jgi:hypothetical protein
MRPGFLVSGILHAAAVAVTLIVWRAPEPPPAKQNPIVPVEIIEFAEETNIKPLAAAVADDATPLTPMSEGAPQELEALPAPDLAPVPKPEPKPAEKPKRNAPPSLDRVAALIDKSAKPGGPPAPAQAAEVSERPRPGIGAGDKMALSEMDAIRLQMRECWRMPVDMAAPENLVVKVRVFFEANGQVRRVVLVSPASLSGLDPPLRAASEAAMRAVRVCNPLRVDPARTQAGQAVLNFDPREMAAR